MRKEKVLLWLAGLFFTTASFSQQHKSFYYVGLGVFKPAYFHARENMSTTGISIELQREQSLMKKFSWTVNAAYATFWGKYTFYRYVFVSPPAEITINQYSSIPISTGLRFHWKQLNMGLKGGTMIGVDKYSGTCPFIAPSIGYKINKEGEHSVDLNLRLLNTLDFGGSDENSLVRGGYGMWELRLAYRFLRAGSKE
ncbi:MAG TPA: hypothetical protein VL728_02480 [Cyclobacteriaceae bacterium]|jgi:hypothetical protein|nr:hypothetical protein [Cyclobacteriaceae bacterium]